jgi:hypothetical protein
VSRHYRGKRSNDEWMIPVIVLPVLGLVMLFGFPMIIGLLDRWINYWGLK